jgi:hypothetical protein
LLLALLFAVFGSSWDTVPVPISIRVVRLGIRDAASIAGLLRTTEAMVAELPKKPPRRCLQRGRAWIIELGRISSAKVKGAGFPPAFHQKMRAPVNLGAPHPSWGRPIIQINSYG